MANSLHETLLASATDAERITDVVVCAIAHASCRQYKYTSAMFVAVDRKCIESLPSYESSDFTFRGSKPCFHI
jgi:hypothetical protein